MSNPLPLTLAPSLTTQAVAETLKQVRAEHAGRVGVQGATDGRQASAKFFISGAVGRWEVTGYGRLTAERGKGVSGEAGVEISHPLRR